MPEFKCGPSRKWMEFRPLNGDNHFTEDEHIFWSHEDEANVDQGPTRWWCESIPGGVETPLPENYFTHEGIEYGYLLLPALNLPNGNYKLCCEIVKLTGPSPHEQEWFFTVFHSQ